MKRFLYGPPNWLVNKFDAEDRRMFGFWVIIFAVIGSFFFGDRVIWVTALSVVALVPNFTSETPVEKQE